MDSELSQTLKPETAKKGDSQNPKQLMQFATARRHRPGRNQWPALTITSLLACLALTGCDEELAEPEQQSAASVAWGSQSILMQERQRVWGEEMSLAAGRLRMDEGTATLKIWGRNADGERELRSITTVREGEAPFLRSGTEYGQISYELSNQDGSVRGIVGLTAKTSPF